MSHARAIGARAKRGDIAGVERVMVRVRWVVVRLDRNEEILQLLDSGYEIQQFIALDEISEHERQRMRNLYSITRQMFFIA